MNPEDCECKRIVDNLIDDQKNYNSHIQKLVECCKIPLNVHWTEKYKDSCLFSIGKPQVEWIEENLNKGIISEVFDNILDDNGVLLSKDVIVTKKDNKWKLTDGENIYTVEKEDERIKFYKISIGYALCSKTMINCLDMLYTEPNEKKLGCSFCNHNKLAPLKIFEEICDGPIKSIVNIYSGNTLDKLKGIIRGYEDNIPELNEKLINTIHEYNADLNEHDHKRKVAIYHLTVLYIYASDYGPPQPKPPKRVRI